MSRMCAALDDLADRPEQSSSESVPEAWPIASDPGGRGRPRWTSLVAAGLVVVAVVAGIALTRRGTPEAVGNHIDAPPDTYQLRLDDARLDVDELTVATGTDEALWRIDGGGWLRLFVRYGTSNVSFGVPTETDLPGTVWLTNVSVGQARTVEARWARPDGDLWFLTEYLASSDDTGRVLGWLGELASGPDGAAAASELLDERSDVAGPVPIRYRSWSIDDHEVTLTVVDNGDASGTANLLAQAAAPPTPTTVRGHDALSFPMNDGGTAIAWDVSPGRWASMRIPADLHDRQDELLAALRPTWAPPATGEQQAYRVIDAGLSHDGRGVVVAAGADQGVQSGHGVYRRGLIGVVQDVGGSTSSVGLLSSSDVEIAASVTYRDPEAPDGSGYASVEGTVHTADGEVVFRPDRSPPGGALSGRPVVVAGGPDSPLLQSKVPIGTILRPARSNDSGRYIVELEGDLADGPVTIIIPG